MLKQAIKTIQKPLVLYAVVEDAADDRKPGTAAEESRPARQPTPTRNRVSIQGRSGGGGGRSSAQRDENTCQPEMGRMASPEKGHVDGRDAAPRRRLPAAERLSVLRNPSTFYTRQSLGSTLQLMGCKPRHAIKISDKAFRKLEHRCLLLPIRNRGPSTCAPAAAESPYPEPENFASQISLRLREDKATRGDIPSVLNTAPSEDKALRGDSLLELDKAPPQLGAHLGTNASSSASPSQSPLLKALGSADAAHAVSCRRGSSAALADSSVHPRLDRVLESTQKPADPSFYVRVDRDFFLDVVCETLSEYQYCGSQQRADLALACSVKEKKIPVIVLLCGTSGCGKSTLASLLASRLGITTVVSTDSLRHMMRGFTSQAESPLLWASTYHAGECLDPADVARAKQRKKADKAAQRGAREGRGGEGTKSKVQAPLSMGMGSFDSSPPAPTALTPSRQGPAQAPLSMGTGSLGSSPLAPTPHGQGTAQVADAGTTEASRPCTPAGLRTGSGAGAESWPHSSPNCSSSSSSRRPLVLGEAGSCEECKENCLAAGGATGPQREVDPREEGEHRRGGCSCSSSVEPLRGGSKGTVDIIGGLGVSVPPTSAANEAGEEVRVREDSKERRRSEQEVMLDGSTSLVNRGSIEEATAATSAASVTAAAPSDGALEAVKSSQVEGVEESQPAVGLEAPACWGDAVSEREMVVEGYKAQSGLVMDAVDRLLTKWERTRTSAVIEGVHLSINLVMELMRKHPSVLPFLVYISNESKHMERFAVRAKYMALDASKNKYVKYLKNIRTIQDYLLRKADKHLVPKVNNTNVDKSVAAIHGTVFSCLRHTAAGEPILRPGARTLPLLHREHQAQYAASGFSSKGMFEVLQRRRLSSKGAQEEGASETDPQGSNQQGPLASDQHGLLASVQEGPLANGQKLGIPQLRTLPGSADDHAGNAATGMALGRKTPKGDELLGHVAEDEACISGSGALEEGHSDTAGLGLHSPLAGDQHGGAQDMTSGDSDTAPGRSTGQSATGPLSRKDTPRKVPFISGLFPQFKARARNGATSFRRSSEASQAGSSPQAEPSVKALRLLGEGSTLPSPPVPANVAAVTERAERAERADRAAESERKRWNLFFESIPMPPKNRLEELLIAGGEAGGAVEVSSYAGVLDHAGAAPPLLQGELLQLHSSQAVAFMGPAPTGEVLGDGLPQEEVPRVKSWTDEAMDSDNEEEHGKLDGGDEDDDKASGSGSDVWSQATEVGEQGEEDEASVVETASSSDWSEDQRSDSLRAPDDWRLPGELAKLQPVQEGEGLQDASLPEDFIERHRSLSLVFDEEERSRQSAARGRNGVVREVLGDRNIDKGGRFVGRGRRRAEG